MFSFLFSAFRNLSEGRQMLRRERLAEAGLMPVSFVMGSAGGAGETSLRVGGHTGGRAKAEGNASALPQRYRKKLSSGGTAVVAYGGDVCAMDWKAMAEAPEAEHGVLVDVAQFKDLYVQAIGELGAMGVSPVLLTLPALLPQRYFDFVSKGLNRQNILKCLGGDVNVLSSRHERYNAAIDEVGKRMGVPVADVSSVLLDRRGLVDCYAADGQHPNRLGMEAIAEAVVAAGMVEAKDYRAFEKQLVLLK